MKSNIKVGLRGLLRISGVTLKPVFRGTLESAVAELKRPSPDMRVVDNELEVLLVIGIPNMFFARPVTVMNGWVYFTCDVSITLGTLAHYCELMELQYELLKD